MVIHIEPEGGYWVEVPSLPGCYSQGETVDELLANLGEAIAGVLEVMQESGIRQRYIVGQHFMQFTTTNEVPFEIPTEWWEGTGMSGFVRTNDYYEVNQNAPFRVIRVSEVTPVRRTPDLEGFSASGFREEKMIPVLRAFRSKIPLRPIEVTEVSKNSAGPWGYELHDGMHRYYASMAVGLSHLPVMVRQEVQDLRSMLDDETKAGAKTQRLKF